MIFPLQLVFETLEVTSFDASVAIGEVTFLDCALPQPGDCNGGEEEFKCQNNVGSESIPIFHVLHLASEHFF